MIVMELKVDVDEYRKMRFMRYLEGGGELDTLIVRCRSLYTASSPLDS